MATTNRQVIIGQTVVLEVDIKDARGQRIDPDAPPEVAIIDSTDLLMRPLSSADIVRIGTGRFRFNYTPPVTRPTGIWQDRWRAVVNGISTDSYFEFIVLSQSADIEVAGDQIGDAPRISFSEEEIIGINILLYCLKNRLKNNLQVETTDAYRNIEYVDCNVFTNDELVWFLKCSLSEFNQTPHFTDFTFAEPVIYERYGHVIVEGAFILATAAQMLIEAGREFTITDNGITMNPPPLSQTLNNELSHFLNTHLNTLKFIKGCIKPQPVGFGSFRVLASNPNYMRLRHLRQRRII